MRREHASGVFAFYCGLFGPIAYTGNPWRSALLDKVAFKPWNLSRSEYATADRWPDIIGAKPAECWPTAGSVVRFRLEIGNMTGRTILGTERTPWNAETFTQATSFGAGYMDGTSAPTTNSSTGVYRVSPDPTIDSEFNQIAAYFVGTGALNGTASARIWGVSRLGTGNNYIGVFLGALTLTLGSGAGVGFYTNTKFVKAISVDIDSSNLPPGIRVLGDSGERAAMLLVDAVGFQYVVIELINVTLGAGEYIGLAWRPI